MFIVMHCMGLPFNGDTIKEGSLGGSETAAYYMARELSAQGHKVTLFTGSQDEGNFDGVRYLNYGRPDESAPLGDRFHFYAERRADHTAPPQGVLLPVRRQGQAVVAARPRRRAHGARGAGAAVERDWRAHRQRVPQAAGVRGVRLRP